MVVRITDVQLKHWCDQARVEWTKKNLLVLRQLSMLARLHHKFKQVEEEGLFSIYGSFTTATGWLNWVVDKYCPTKEGSTFRINGGQCFKALIQWLAEGVFNKFSEEEDGPEYDNVYDVTSGAESGEAVFLASIDEQEEEDIEEGKYKVADVDDEAFDFLDPHNIVTNDYFVFMELLSSMENATVLAVEYFEETSVSASASSQVSMGLSTLRTAFPATLADGATETQEGRFELLVRNYVASWLSLPVESRSDQDSEISGERTAESGSKGSGGSGSGSGGSAPEGTIPKAKVLQYAAVLKEVTGHPGGIEQYVERMGLDEAAKVVLEVAKASCRGLTVANKGASTRLLTSFEVQDRNPIDGSVVPQETPISTRVQTAFRVGYQSHTGEAPARSNWSCWVCNAPAVLRCHLVAGQTDELTRYGEKEVKQLQIIDGGRSVCPAHPGMYGRPPMGGTTFCPRESCGVLIQTHKEIPLVACPECSLPFGQAEATESYGVRGKIKAAVTEAALAAEVDERCFDQLLYMGGGGSIFAAMGHQKPSLAEARASLLRLRNKPQQVAALMGNCFPVEISAEIVEHLLVGRFSCDLGHLYLGASMDMREQAKLSPISEAARKKAKTGMVSCPAKGDVDHGAFRQNLIKYDENLRELVAMLWGDNFESDIRLSTKLIKFELDSSIHAPVYQNNCMLAEFFNSHWKCFSERLEASVRAPHTSQLFHHERQAGGIIRLLPYNQSVQFLAAIPAALAEASIAQATEVVASGVRKSNPMAKDLPTEAANKKAEAKEEAKDKAHKKELAEAEVKLEELNAKLNRERKKNKEEKDARKDRSGDAGPKTKVQNDIVIPLPLAKKQGLQKVLYKEEIVEIIVEEGDEEQVLGKEEALQSSGYASRFAMPAEIEFTTDKIQVEVVPEEPPSSEMGDPDEFLCVECLTPGELPSRDSSKIKHLIPRVESKGGRHQHCPWHHTMRGCPDNDREEHCPYFHAEVLIPAERWPIEWHLVFLLYGGHAELNGKLPLDALLQLVPPRAIASLLASPLESKEAMLSHFLQRRLGHLLRPQGEPLSTRALEKEGSRIVEDPLWDASCPFQFSSPSGLPVDRVSRIVYGSANGVMSGLKQDVGQSIVLPDGSDLPFMCHVKNLAAQGLPAKAHLDPNATFTSPDLALTREILDSLLSIDPSLLMPGSELASLFVEISQMQRAGVIDQVWRIASAPSLDNTPIHIVSGFESDGPLTVTLNLPSRVGGDTCRVRYPSLPGQRQQTSQSFASRFQGHNAKVEGILGGMRSLIIEPSSGPIGRHSSGLNLGKLSTLSNLWDKLSRLLEAGEVVVVLEERGSEDTARRLSRVRAAHPVSESKINEARQRILELRERCGEGRQEEKAPLLQRSGDVGIKAVKVTEQEERIFEEAIPDSEVPESPAGPARPSPKTQEDWNQWCRTRLGDDLMASLNSHEEFAEFWSSSLEPFLNSESFKDRDRSGSVTLAYSSLFFNAWVKWSLQFAVSNDEKLEESPARTHLLAIVTAIRNRAFGGQASSLPSWDKIEEVFGDSLSEQHLLLLKEMVQEGADAHFVDISKGAGRRASPAKEIIKIRDKLLEDMAAEVSATRGIVFGTWDPDIEEFLFQAGVHVSSVVTTPKTKDDGTVRRNKFDEELLRICNNLSDGDDGVNKGLWSSDHTAQKTTSHAMIALKYVTEEKRYPSSPIRMSKEDVRLAFKRIGHLLRCIGLFASQVDGYSIVYLTMIFGAAASPGCYEVFGDAIITTLLTQGREDLEKTGPSHPETARFVDDFLSIMAVFGNRAPDHVARLRFLIQALFGEEGLNQEKLEEVGDLSSFKHAFGVVIDSVERLFKAPWSKVCKLDKLVEPFINSKEKINLDVLYSLRGVAWHVTICAPSFRRFVMARLDAGLSDAAKNGKLKVRSQSSRFSHPKMDRSYQPSFALRGETPEQGEEVLRYALRLTLALAAVKKGKLLEVKPEAILPRAARCSWPGKEGPEDLKNILMDASGKTLWLLDLQDGEHVKIMYTEKEAALFNAFEKGEAATTINLFEMWSEAVAIAVFAHKYPGKILRMINDNTSAQSWTDFSRHRDPKVEQIIALMGLSELVLKQTVIGDRAITAQNFADNGTREELTEELLAGLRERAKKYGWKTEAGVAVEPPEWVRNYGYDLVAYDSLIPRWHQHLVNFVEETEAKASGIIKATSGVEPDQILEALDLALSERPLTPLVFDHDFIEGEPSEERVQLTAQVHTTETQFFRKLEHIRQQHKSQSESDYRFANWAAGKYGLEFESTTEVPKAEFIIAMLLQRQHQKNYEVLKVENKNFDNSGKRLSDPITKWKPPPECLLVRDPGIISGYAGINPFGTAADYSVGHSVAIAERQPKLLEFHKKRSPNSELLTDVKYLLEERFRYAAEFLYLSPVCTIYSPANLYAKEIDDPLFGSQVAQCAEIIKHVGAPISGLECVIGILKGKNGRAAAIKKFRRGLPDHHIRIHEIDAGKTESPITGEVSALKHIRAHVMTYRKDCFPDEAELDWEINKAHPKSSFADVLDLRWEGHSYRRMSTEDQRALVLRSHQTKEGAAYIGSLKDPSEKGRGHHLYVNEVVDPLRGRAPPWTATGASVWVARELNDKADITLMSNREGARLYCLREDELPDEALEDDSYLGQSNIGNSIPGNVRDFVHIHNVLLLGKKQADGFTPQEKWLSKQKGFRSNKKGRASSGGNEEVLTRQASGGKGAPSPRKKRKEVEMSPPVLAQIRKLVDSVKVMGKVSGTRLAYDRMQKDWLQVCNQMGWSPDLTQLVQDNPSEATSRVLTWFGYERMVHGLKASSLRQKRAAVRNWHIDRKQPDPFLRLTAVADWLDCLAKVDGPAKPKIPVPVSLLKFIVGRLQPDRMQDQALKSALCVGYWFLLRASEYLAADSGRFDPDRSISWNDLFFRFTDKAGNAKVGTPQEASKALAQGLEVSATLTLFSNKNRLGTCTRSVVATPGSSLCPVSALLDQHASFKKHVGREPRPEEAIMTKDPEGGVYRRKDISNVLKAAAQLANIPEAMVASHSLRRGGASAYVASGASDDDVMRHGRWTSEAYRAYVYAALDKLKFALRKAQVAVPKFEKN